MNFMTLEIATTFCCPFKPTKCSTIECLAWKRHDVEVAGEPRSLTLSMMDLHHKYLASRDFDIGAAVESEVAATCEYPFRIDHYKKTLDHITIEYHEITMQPGGKCKCIP